MQCELYSKLCRVCDVYLVDTGILVTNNLSTAGEYGMTLASEDCRPSDEQFLHGSLTIGGPVSVKAEIPGSSV